MGRPEITTQLWEYRKGPKQSDFKIASIKQTQTGLRYGQLNAFFEVRGTKRCPGHKKVPRPGHKKVPRPGHKKVPPPDQSNGAPFCAPVGAGLIPSDCW